MPVQSSSKSLPIPDKLYFTIGEVSKLCELKPHVLRYWEQEFPGLEPVKRQGNRRYYQRKDILLVRRIKDLLYNQGFTIEGARMKLAEDSGSSAVSDTQARELLADIVSDLESVLSELNTGI